MTVHVITNVRTGQAVKVALTAQEAEQWTRDNVGGPWRVTECVAVPVETPRSERVTR